LKVPDWTYDPLLPGQIELQTPMAAHNYDREIRGKSVHTRGGHI